MSDGVIGEPEHLALDGRLLSNLSMELDLFNVVVQVAEAAAGVLIDLKLIKRKIMHLSTHGHWSKEREIFFYQVLSGKIDFPIAVVL